MIDKRFTMCNQQNDLNGWTLSIVDWETDQPFDYTQYEVHSASITDTRDEMEDLCLLLNELNDENEQLKQELKVYRKIASCSNCHYHDYDTLFGGDDEYEICEKGNDVTDGICNEWRES